MSWVKCNNFLD